MNKKLESLAVVVSYFPVDNSRGISPKKGIVTITENGLELVSRWYILGNKSYDVPFADMDGYSVTPSGLYINHHSKAYPSFISIRKLPFISGSRGDEELDKLSQALKSNGVKSQPLQVRKSTKVLLTVFLFAFLSFAAFLIWSGLYSGQ